MPHPHRALGRDVPHVERERHEVVGRDAALVGQPVAPALLGAARPPEASLAGHDDPLGHVAQHRVGGGAERAPGARAAGALALLPHDLAPRQQVQVVLQDGHHVGGQAAIRLAPEVGDVDRDAAARLEHPLALGEDVAQQRQVLDVGPGHALAVELLLVLLAGEVGRRGDDEGHRVVRHRVHAAGVTAQAGHPGLVRGHVLVGAELGRLEAGVEGVGDVGLAAPDTEIGGRGATAGRHGRSLEPYRPARCGAGIRSVAPGHGGQPRERL